LAFLTKYSRGAKPRPWAQPRLFSKAKFSPHPTLAGYLFPNEPRNAPTTQKKPTKKGFPLSSGFRSLAITKLSNYQKLTE